MTGLDIWLGYGTYPTSSIAMHPYYDTPYKSKLNDNIGDILCK